MSVCGLGEKKKKITTQKQLHHLILILYTVDSNPGKVICVHTITREFSRVPVAPWESRGMTLRGRFFLTFQHNNIKQNGETV